MTAKVSVPWWLVWLAYIALVVFTTAHHEPWRDEAQAWLIARDLPLPDLFAQMAYEGSPALWHLLLVPFAKLGAPYAWEAAIHVVLAVAAVGLLLARAPFPLWLKALLAFSFYLSYEYAAVARNYNLSLLLLCGLAVLHATRLTRPWAYAVLVALLSNTNVHSVMLAATLALWFAVDARSVRTRRPRLVIALGIMAAGVAMALAQLAGADRNAMVGAGLHFDPAAPLLATRNAWLPGLPGAAAPIAAATMIFVAVTLWRWARSVSWVLASGLGGLFAIFALKHGGDLRHHGLILVFSVFALWVAWDRLSVAGARRWRRALLVALGLSLVAGLPFSVRHHVAEARGMFSGAGAMAAWIAEAGLADRLLVAHPSAQASALLPYLPHTPLWYADIQAFGTYVTWDRRYVESRFIAPTEAARRATAAPGWGIGSLLLVTEPLPEPARFGLRPRHQVGDEVFTDLGERYYLYERVDEPPP